MARVLILRRHEEAQRTARLVSERGHEPLILPTEEVVALPGPPPSRDVEGFLVTSANAVGALAAAFPRDGRPLLAVGKATAKKAQDAGFSHIKAGSGKAEDLAALVSTVFGQPRRPLLYATGRQRTATLEQRLAASGIAHLVWEAYDMRPLHPSGNEIAAAVGGKPADFTLLLSAAQARAFAALIDEEPALLGPARPLCLSPRIRDALPFSLADAAAISPEPHLLSLFDCFL
ncbi:uroporphyrinogen-III synthase [Consotaella salsifontis]|uniref:Uroporphyrinogen-III synthase n=1 Tax=Consotaella salsifontis TaxID=1365950 RepID=A0A1T4QSC6_9HYPH|nr:uroporphyrinogen-III synthase [Consotaella salsifontis]SKA06391.1 uroporphyrinogen-III synthase [Consotaella salsifontis]